VGNALIQGAGIQSFPVIPGHDFPFFHQVFKLQFQGVHGQFFGQFIHGRLHGKGALGGAVSPEGSGGHGVGIDDLVGKPYGLGLVI